MPFSKIHFFQILNKTGKYRRILVKISCIKFEENPYSRSPVLPSRQRNWVAWQAVSILPFSRTTYPKESFQLKNFHSKFVSKHKNLFQLTMISCYDSKPISTHSSCLPWHNIMQLATLVGTAKGLQAGKQRILQFLLFSRNRIPSFQAQNGPVVQLTTRIRVMSQWSMRGAASSLFNIPSNHAQGQLELHTPVLA